MSDRPTRKEMKHDKFVEDVGHAYDYASQNRRNILLGIAAVAAIAVILWGVSIYRKGQETKAQTALAEAIAIMDAPTGASAEAPAGEVEYKTDEEKFATAEPLLRKVVADHGGTDAADVAGLYLARISASRGDLAAAREGLETFVRGHRDHVLAGAAQLSLYELRMQPEEAASLITDLEAAVEAEESLVPKDALLSLLGRAYEMQGNREKARAAYQRIVTEFPDSAYTIDAQRSLATA